MVRSHVESPVYAVRGHQTATLTLVSPRGCARAAARVVRRQLTSMKRIRRQQELEAQSAPLRMAAEVGDLSKVRALVMAGGAQIDIDAGGKHGVTALHRAADRERDDVVRLLLQAGADHGKQTNRGRQTALMLAAKRGNCAICEMLVQAGADVNVKNSEGWDAMMFASARRHNDVVVLLARASADAERCSPGGVSATDLLSVWHEDPKTANRARHATQNSDRARQQLRLWEEERARHAAQADYLAERDLEHPSDSVGTPRSADSPTTLDPAPLATSPRDVESDARLLLAATEDQKRRQEEAQIDSLLQRSRQPIAFQTEGSIERWADSTPLLQSTTLSAGEMTATPPVAITSETALRTVNLAALDAAATDITAPTVEPGRATTTTVRDQDHVERQEARRARISAMRRELEESLAS